jgi:hypothetical protein
MKSKSLSSLLVLGMVVGLSAQNAHAWGKKLDLNEIQGTYETSLDGPSALNCVMDIRIVYDAAKGTVDAVDMSTAANVPSIHFSLNEKDNKATAQEAIPDHSEFQNDSVKTSLTSNSIEQEQISDRISGNVDPTFIDGPMDSPVPMINGQQVFPQTVSDHYATITTKLQYNSKTKQLVKSVSYGDITDESQTCRYDRK